jgi:glycine/D-amino acid oxidase-like deaminating enzyme
MQILRKCMGRLRVAILGCGIKGAAAAAYLSASRQADIVAFERSVPGSGISSTNHGRFHSGTWNFYRATPEAIKRNRDAFQIASQFPHLWECKSPGFYCVESTDNAEQFLRYFDALGFEFDEVRSTDDSCWIRPERYRIFEVPEYSFNPARLAARLMRFAENTGVCRIHFGTARNLTKRNGVFQITTATGESVEVDAVINAMGGWLTTLRTDLPIWQPKLIWNCWRLLCVNSDLLGLPQLARVLTVDRARNIGQATPGPLVLLCYK